MVGIPDDNLELVRRPMARIGPLAFGSTNDLASLVDCQTIAKSMPRHPRPIILLNAGHSSNALLAAWMIARPPPFPKHNPRALSELPPATSRRCSC